MDQLTIKQFNSDTPNLELDRDIFKVFALAAIPFRGGLTLEEFTTVETNHILNTSGTWQYIYLVNNDDEIVASVGVIFRDSVKSNLFNLCLSMVNTNEKYRGKGIMSKFLKYVVALYEGKEDSIDLGNWNMLKDDDIKGFSVKHTKEKQGFWTLYSIVGEYYGLFGFKSFKTMNWLKSRPINNLLEGCSKDDFRLNEGEIFITRDNVKDLYLNVKWIPDQKEFDSEGIRCTSFKEPSYFKFLERSKIYADSKGFPIENFGISIEEANGERSMIFVGPNLMGYQLEIHRIFTNVTDPKVLKKHLGRMYQYLIYHCAKYLTILPIFINAKKDKYMAFTEGDIISKNLNKSIIVSWFRDELEWEYDDSNEILPMLKEFGKDTNVDDLVWPYNGYWCF